jgi:transcriptional regulator with XRE-family HTH domain
MKITDRLKGLLADHRMSQTQFAEAISVRRETVSRWFTGETSFNPDKTTIDLILAVAKTFDPTIDYDQLFGESALPPAASE